ncbi:MAG: DNA-protecting protein DprA [Eubacteriaceae bacterium]|nr:DNA-protecting protein DprA [Eubacteriaceae bacterium]
MEYWIWMMSPIGISVKYKNLLLNCFESPKEVYEASEQDYRSLNLLTDKQIRTLCQNKNMDLTHQAMAYMEEKNIGFINREDKAFPSMLLDIFDPPIGLFLRGDSELLQRPIKLGMVGSRKASPQGMASAYRFAKELSSHGMTIVSGLADGIDGQSHWGSVDSIGSTIAVIGTGIDRCYPNKNKKLFLEIVEKGLVVSEFFLGQKPLPYHFPQRNRIISGLSDGLLVVEARQKSGALITAGMALEQGKTVYALPGDVRRFQSEGSNQLIKDGAKLVTSIKDILEDYVYTPETKQHTETTSNTALLDMVDSELEKKCLKFILEGYQSADDLVFITGESIRDINTTLSLLEIKDLVINHNGTLILKK